MKKRKAESGFTLIEVLIVVAIILVMVALGGPALINYSPKQNMRSAARDLKSNLELAKMEAVKTKKPVVVTFSNLGTCGRSFESGGTYSMFIDENRDGEYTAPTPPNQTDKEEYIPVFGGKERDTANDSYTTRSNVAICLSDDPKVFHFTSRGFPAEGKSGDTVMDSLSITLASSYRVGNNHNGFTVNVSPAGNITLKRATP